MNPKAGPQYKKILVDNPICRRRFHIAFEDSPETQTSEKTYVKLACPHCGAVIYEEKNHTPAIITREENLIKAPDGSHPVVYTCNSPGV